MIDVFTPKRISPDCPFNPNHPSPCNHRETSEDFDFVSAVCSLSPRYVAQHGDRLRCVKRQLYERLSRQNRNRIRKKFSQFIRGTKKNGGRKSRDTLPFNLIPGCGVSPGKKKKSPIFTLLQYIATVYSPPLSVQKRIL